MNKSIQIIKNEIRSNFSKVYHSEILPQLGKEETKRRKIMSKLVFWEIVSVIVFVFNCLFFKTVLVKLMDYEIGYLLTIISFLIGITALGVIFLLPYSLNKTFTEELKQILVPKLIKSFGDIKWSHCSTIISASDLNKSELFAKFNERTQDDCFLGKYKDVDYAILESKLTYETKGRKNNHVIDVFKGIIINFASNKTIKNKTIIATKNDKNILGKNLSYMFTLMVIIVAIVTRDLEICTYGVIGVVMYIVTIWNERKDKKEVLNEIKLEDPEFNKKFRAYSSDEVEGRYLITTAFMERFNNLKTVFGTSKVKCSFYGENVMFAISTNRNLFEVGNLFTPLSSTKNLEVFFEELVSVLLLVDYFKLDQKIGL